MSLSSLVYVAVVKTHVVVPDKTHFLQTAAIDRMQQVTMGLPPLLPVTLSTNRREGGGGGGEGGERPSRHSGRSSRRLEG